MISGSCSLVLVMNKDASPPGHGQDSRTKVLVVVFFANFGKSVNPATLVRWGTIDADQEAFQHSSSSCPPFFPCAVSAASPSPHRTVHCGLSG